MLSEGNSKLGKRILSFSIPPLATCPGKTPLCASFCYATRGHFSWPSVLATEERNLERSQSAVFVGGVVADVYTRRPAAVRVHCAGDFHTAGYIRKWLRIARACPQTIFYGYTRSWRVPRLLPALRALARQPNVYLWLSADRDSSEPACRSDFAGVAYLATADDDLPDYPVELVFRNDHRLPMKFTPRGDFVCPYEQGVKRQVKLTCSRCRYCFTAQSVRRRPTVAAPPVGRQRRLPLSVVR